MRGCDHPFSAHIVGGKRFLALQKLFIGPLEDDVAAEFAGARAHVHDIVGAADDFRVMLNDDHGVVEISQLLQGIQEFLVVPGMKTDGRFVQHVHHAGKARADLT